MPVPTNLTDLSTTASSNSPASSESPVDGDNYLRAHAAFVAQLNANKLDKTGSVAATANQPMGGYKHTGAAAGSASGHYLTYGQSSAVLGGLAGITATGTDSGLTITQADETGSVPALLTVNSTASNAPQFAVYHNGANVYIGNTRASNLYLFTENALRVQVTSSGDVLPTADGTQDFGSSSFKWADVQSVLGTFGTAVYSPVIQNPSGALLHYGVGYQGFVVDDVLTVIVDADAIYPNTDNAIAIGDPSKRWTTGHFSGTLTAGAFSGAGTSLTGTAAALSIGGNAATATNATTAAACSGNAATASAVAWSGVTSIPAAVSSAAAGTYTPTLTAVSNVSASTAYDAMYTRVGDVVTVSGSCLVTPTAAGFTQLDISLPVASNVGGTNSVAGVAASISGTAGTSPARITAAPVQDRAMSYFYDDNGGSRLMSYQFSYVVI